jgi:NADH:ubiquinone oxidoreductase subunit C
MEYIHFTDETLTSITKAIYRKRYEQVSDLLGVLYREYGSKDSVYHTYNVPPGLLVFGVANEAIIVEVSEDILVRSISRTKRK